MKLLAFYLAGFIISIAAEVTYHQKEEVVLNEKDYPIYVGYSCFPDTDKCEKPKDL